MVDEEAAAILAGARAPTPGTWLELAVAADVEAVEAVSEILTRVAPGGTTVEPAFRLEDEGLAAVVDTARPAIVRAYLPAGDAVAARAAIDAAETALGHLQAFDLRPIGELSVHALHEADWADAWKRHFPVLRVGRRLVIRPTWRRHRAAPGDVVIALDPGMAFGTGLHPTTRLCLAEIEALADEGCLAAGRGRDGAARVLDVGCGSGILSIAAVLLGAGSAVARDIDPIAIDSTAANARRNRVARRVHVRQGSLPASGGPFDVVLANLVAGLLVSLADGLAGELRPGGTLVASGIFVDREDEVRRSLAGAGLLPVSRRAEGDWVALRFGAPH